MQVYTRSLVGTKNASNKDYNQWGTKCSLSWWFERLNDSRNCIMYLTRNKCCRVQTIKPLRIIRQTDKLLSLTDNTLHFLNPPILGISWGSRDNYRAVKPKYWCSANLHSLKLSGFRKQQKNITERGWRDNG